MAVAAPALAVRLGSGALIGDNDQRMNDLVREASKHERLGGAGAIRRRHVVYLSGYEPRGAQGYFELFRRTFDRSQRLWPVSLVLRPLQIDSEDFAHWQLEMRGSGWHTTTRYDFVRLERFIQSDMSESTARQIFRALTWLADDVASGALFRIFRASWRFGLHLLCSHLLLLAWIAAAAAVAAIIGHALDAYLGWPIWAAVVPSLVAMVLILLALRPLADRWLLIQISNSWTNSRRFARGRPTWLDTAIDAAAQRVIAVARANEVDELAVIGHSSGCVLAMAVAARAMELDPDLGRDGPRLVLLTLGSVMPAVALHPAADRVRRLIGRLATTPALTWVDCQSRKDVMCFANFDPVSGVGIDVGSRRTNPLLWRISFRDVIAPQNYNRFRLNNFRVHYQYIMGGDRRGPYDYILLVGGPAAIAQWPERAPELVAAFAEAEIR
jgi:pimeloyl-ACP methyl ester carboxylesterase